MQIVAHRINTIAHLRRLPLNFGVELDLRAMGSDLILNHDPFKVGERFVDFLGEYRHGLMIINIKEAGIENEALRLVRDRGISDFFLLDVEFPYVYSATRKGERAIAIRYSEDESIETVLKYQGRLDWVWIDTISQLPLNPDIIKQLEGFKTCLVCPERWGRPEDIAKYRRNMFNLGFRPNAVMTNLDYCDQWCGSMGPA
jgi:hypothetical protein